MTRNGISTRLTSCVLGVNTSYASDEQLPLTNRMGNKVITVLFGLGPIAEKTTDWNYLLTDGASLPRQLTDMNGEVTLSVRYSPWGKAMDISGIGNFDASYIGTLIDATTGLIYIGNGQYYDPETGRFLTRGVFPNNTNPYVPWNPTGLLLGPLGLVSLFSSRKKGKSKGRNRAVLIAILVLAMANLACCHGPSPAPTPTPEPSPSPTPTPSPVPNPNPIEPPPTPTEPPTEPPHVANGIQMNFLLLITTMQWKQIQNLQTVGMCS
jgi:RHS repeat-associated protein